MTDVDDYEDYDRDPDPAEPNCGCWDTGYARPRRWWRQDGPYARTRPGRERCASCNPSPRQQRRNALRWRRDRQRFLRDVATGRIAADNRAPF